MERIVNVWSKAYSPTVDTDPYSIQVDQDIWEEIIHEDLGRRVFLQIQHPGNHGSWFAPLGQPVPHDREQTQNPNIYLPLWMIEAARLEGIGEALQVTFLGDEAFPHATRLIFQVVDSAFYNSDVKEELERALTSLGLVRRETTIQIPISSLGGFNVEVFVVETEPAECVLCDGEEVVVEFREPVDQYISHPPERPPTPIPEELPFLIPDPENSSAEIPPQAHVFPPRNELIRLPTFPGEGHVLGSDPSIPPPIWHQPVARRIDLLGQGNFPQI